MSPQKHKRSWRNLVLDRDYQLLFTLMIVASCALFMAGLGYFVLKEANTATQTAIQQVRGEPLIEPDVARATIERLESRGRLLIVVLVGLGAALSGGLFFYGIKMTHHVAGPLHKIGLYCEKVAAGTYDKIYPLRKGDQLGEFYEHFKQAHEVLRQRNDRDVETLRALLAAADDAELAARSPDLADRLAEVREALARKEGSHA